MTDPLDALLDRMERGEIVPKLVLSADAIDEALDRRDRTDFDKIWVDASRRVEAKKRSVGVQPAIPGGQVLDDADKRVTRLRELAYLQSFDGWQSPDLAGEISDDFGLIGDALSLGMSEPWVEALLRSYEHHRFPSSATLDVGD
jgi:hypothetical protein